VPGDTSVSGADKPMNPQLSLGIRPRDDATFANFWDAPNAEAVLRLRQVATGVGERFVYLWGRPGSGRSHLLQAACHAAGERGEAAVYLPLAISAELAPQVLEGMEALSLVCLDDLDCVAGRVPWERAAFHLYNRLRDGGARLLVAASAPPAALLLTLPDLRSRLASGLVFRLHDLGDADKLAALRLRARGRGLELSEEVAQFLLRRHPRDLIELLDALVRLDEASMVDQRRLTIPFVKAVLGL
jgi:DnaA family protein